MDGFWSTVERSDTERNGTGRLAVPVLDGMNGTAKTSGTATAEAKNRPYLVRRGIAVVTH